MHSSTYLPRYGRLDSRGPLELRVLEGWTQSHGQTAIEVLDGPGVFVMALRITLVELPAPVDGRLPKDVYSLFRFPARGVPVLEAICRRAGYEDSHQSRPQTSRTMRPAYRTGGRPMSEP